MGCFETWRSFCRYIIFSSLPQIRRCISKIDESSTWLMWVSKIPFGHDPYLAPPSKRAFWENLHGDFFEFQMTFFSFLENFIDMKNILQTQTHPLTIIKPTPDSPMQFNCRKHIFSRFSVSYSDLHIWPLVNCRKTKMTNFFQKVINQ